LFLFFDTPSILFKIFSIIAGIGLIITHRKNIDRLIKGEEKKLITLGKRKKSTS
jgi:glycerol-3-phosphate acyltransferase PlsY